MADPVFNPVSRQYEYPMEAIYADREVGRTRAYLESVHGPIPPPPGEQDQGEVVQLTPEQNRVQAHQAILAEPDVKKAVDTLTQYRQMRAADGPDGGIYNADELGRKGFKDRGPAKDPIEFVTGLLEDAFKFSSPDIKGTTPGTPGDVKGMQGIVKTLTGALRRMTSGAAKAGEVAAAAPKTSVAAGVPSAVATPAAGVKAGPQAVEGVNPSRLAGSAPDVQAVVANIGEYNATRMEAGVVTHAETIAKAEHAMSLDEALNLDPAKHDLATMQTAVTGHFKAAEAYFRDVAKRVVAGDPSAAAEYWTAFAATADLAQKDALLGTQVGRGLEARKIRLEELKSAINPDQFKQLAEQMGLAAIEGGMDPAIHAQRMLALTPSQRLTGLTQAANFFKAGQNALYEAWINALLSGPQTHAANILSNAATAAWAPGERFLSALASAGETGVTLGAHDRTVFFGEAPQMLYGLVEGAKDGIRLMGKAITQGGGGVGQKVERIPAITANAFGLNPDGLVGAGVDYLGAVIRTPTRGLVAEDEFFKAINYRMELHALAYREASQAGLSGPAFSKRVAEIIADPPAAVKARADAFALAQTFNQNLDSLGPMARGLGKGAQAFADNVPMGRIILPFVRTPANILNYASERTPILNAIATSIGKDIATGGPEARSLALGKVAAGGLASAAIASYAATPINADNPVPFMTTVTGDGPHDKAQRAELQALGWQPYSVWTGTEYVSYKRMDPLGTVMGIVSTATEIMGQLPEQGALEIAEATRIAVGRAMLSKTFLTGLSDWLEAQQGAPDKINKFWQSLARSGVPAGVRQTTNTLDPIRREMDTLFDQWRSGLPGYDGPPVLNLWGDPVMLGGGVGPDIVSPLRTSPGKSDDVTEWLLQNHVPVTGAPKVVAGTPPQGVQLTEPTARVGIKLTKEEHHRLGTLMGKAGDAPSIGPDLGGMAGLPPLKDAIREIIAGPGTGGPDGSKADLIRQRVQDYKRAAIQQLRRESPMLDEHLSALEKRRIELKTDDSLAPQPKGPAGLMDVLQKSLGR